MGHEWHVRKCWQNSDVTRQNVFPRWPFILSPAPKVGQSASDRPLSICLHLCLILSSEEYYHQHIHPSDISRINKQMHTQWHTHTQIQSTCFDLADTHWTNCIVGEETTEQRCEKTIFDCLKKSLGLALKRLSISSGDKQWNYIPQAYGM